MTALDVLRGSKDISTGWTAFDLYQHVTKFCPNTEITIYERPANIRFSCPNGLIISCNIDTMGYNDNRAFFMDRQFESLPVLDKAKRTTNVELALWNDNEGIWLNFGHDTVEGWVPTDSLKVIIESAQDAQAKVDIAAWNQEHEVRWEDEDD